MAICPNGHDSVTDDVCAVCGARIATSPVRVVGRHHAGGPPLAGDGENTCPWCGNPSSGQFCARCGFRVRRPFAPLAEPVSAEPVPAENEPEPPAFMDWFSPAERTRPAEPHAAFDLAESLGPPESSGPSESSGPPEPADLPEPPELAEPDRPAAARPALSAPPVVPAPPAPPVASSVPPTAPMPKYTPTTWSVVVTSDRDYFDRMQLKRALTSSAVAFPAISSERRFELSGKQMRIGRRSPARGVEPEIDLSGSPVDPGVSRLHALLLPGPDGLWALLDPGSANGTLLNGSEVMPGDLIPLHDGDRINLGAWTAITICRG